MQEIRCIIECFQSDVYLQLPVSRIIDNSHIKSHRIVASSPRSSPSPFYLFLLAILVSQDLFLFEVSWNNAVEFYLFLLGGHCATGVCSHAILNIIHPTFSLIIIDDHSTSSDIILPLLYSNRLSSHPCWRSSDTYKKVPIMKIHSKNNNTSVYLHPLD